MRWEGYDLNNLPPFRKFIPQDPLELEVLQRQKIKAVITCLFFYSIVCFSLHFYLSIKQNPPISLRLFFSTSERMGKYRKERDSLEQEREFIHKHQRKGWAWDTDMGCWEACASFVSCIFPTFQISYVCLRDYVFLIFYPISTAAHFHIFSPGFLVSPQPFMLESQELIIWTFWLFYVFSHLQHFI